jgi:hypothetical protein
MEAETKALNVDSTHKDNQYNMSCYLIMTTVKFHYCFKNGLYTITEYHK